MELPADMFHGAAHIDNEGNCQKTTEALTQSGLVANKFFQNAPKSTGTKRSTIKTISQWYILPVIPPDTQYSTTHSHLWIIKAAAGSASQSNCDGYRQYRVTTAVAPPPVPCTQPLHHYWVCMAPRPHSLSGTPDQALPPPTSPTGKASNANVTFVSFIQRVLKHCKANLHCFPPFPTAGAKWAL